MHSVTLPLHFWRVDATKLFIAHIESCIYFIHRITSPDRSLYQDTFNVMFRDGNILTWNIQFSMLSSLTNLFIILSNLYLFMCVCIYQAAHDRMCLKSCDDREREASE